MEIRYEVGPTERLNMHAGDSMAAGVGGARVSRRAMRHSARVSMAHVYFNMEQTLLVELLRSSRRLELALSSKKKIPKTPTPSHSIRKSRGGQAPGEDYAGANYGVPNLNPNSNPRLLLLAPEQQACADALGLSGRPSDGALSASSAGSNSSSGSAGNGSVRLPSGMETEFSLVMKLGGASVALMVSHHDNDNNNSPALHRSGLSSSEHNWPPHIRFLTSSSPVLTTTA